MYHPQLAYCIVQFLEKDAALTEEVPLKPSAMDTTLADVELGRTGAAKILAESQ